MESTCPGEPCAAVLDANRLALHVPLPCVRSTTVDCFCSSPRHEWSTWALTWPYPLVSLLCSTAQHCLPSVSPVRCKTRQQPPLHACADGRAWDDAAARSPPEVSAPCRKGGTTATATNRSNMAPNKRGGAPNVAALPPSTAKLQEGSVIAAEDVAARGRGTAEDYDTYGDHSIWHSETRTVLTGRHAQARWNVNPCRSSALGVVVPAGVMFLTRLPCPGWCDHHPAYLMRSMAYFPIIGAVVGVWGAAFFAAAAVLWPPIIAAGLSTLATVWLTGGHAPSATAAWLAPSALHQQDGQGGPWRLARLTWGAPVAAGCFHEDGLADCFDGFGGGWGKSQILRIMKDSRVGTCEHSIHHPARSHVHMRW